MGLELAEKALSFSPDLDVVDGDFRGHHYADRNLIFKSDNLLHVFHCMIRPAALFPCALADIP